MKQKGPVPVIDQPDAEKVSDDPAANLEVYNSSEIAAYYGALTYLTPCEKLLMDTHVKPGMEVLDLGVGGGRTVPYLSQIAGRYVGVDYAPEMVKICRQKFPNHTFLQADAADLSQFPQHSFDVVFFSFNGLDMLAPAEKRLRCLQECNRVLRPGGKFIFSCHNPRAIFVWPAWNADCVRAFSRRISGEKPVLYPLLLVAVTSAKALLSTLRSTAESLKRIVRRVPARSFLRGEGYVLDSAHGGLVTHCWVPAKVIAEVESFQFKCIQVLGDDYPRKSGQFITDWYYYVFASQG